MRGIVGLIILLALGAGIALVTKPSEADAEAVLRQQVLTLVASEELDGTRSTGENLALAACKLRPSDCYDLLRSAMKITFTDQTLFLRVDLEGLDRTATCYGAFTQFVCPGGLKKT